MLINRTIHYDTSMNKYHESQYRDKIAYESKHLQIITDLQCLLLCIMISV